MHSPAVFALPLLSALTIALAAVTPAPRNVCAGPKELVSDAFKETGLTPPVAPRFKPKTYLSVLYNATDARLGNFFNQTGK
jgi:hypothetical protein